MKGKMLNGLLSQEELKAWAAFRMAKEIYQD